MILQFRVSEMCMCQLAALLDQFLIESAHRVGGMAMHGGERMKFADCAAYLHN